MSTISQQVEPVVSKTLRINTSCPTGLDLRVAIRRFDSYYLDSSDGVFKALGSVVSPYTSLSEDPVGSGEYTVALDVTSWSDGNYTTILTDHTVDPDSPVTLDAGKVIYVDGGSGGPLGSAKTRIDHNFGGVDAMRYLDPDGNPVDAASIYIFTSAVYDADATEMQAEAVTQTKADGRWVSPVFLDPGSYVAVFLKTSYWGPDTHSFTVI